MTQPDLEVDDSSSDEPPEPLTGFGKVVVAAGAACLIGAGVMLVGGDTPPWSSCSVVQTRTLEPSATPPPTTMVPGAPSGRPSKTAPTPSPTPKPTQSSNPALQDGQELVLSEEVTSCSAPTLTSGVSLLLALVGLLLIAPGLLRILPRGDYGWAGVHVNTKRQRRHQAANDSIKSATELNKAFEQAQSLADHSLPSASPADPNSRHEGETRTDQPDPPT